MARAKTHDETHFISRVGWLRAAVLGANDGIVSTASLILGVAAASEGKGPILVAGVAAWVAGAMSMAAGEYVSVSSQLDTEKAAIAQEKRELRDDGEAELEELARIYRERGLDPALARQVAEQLTEHDALGAHARDELGLSEVTAAKPIEAAVTSALTFSAGALAPLAVVLLSPLPWLPWTVSVASLAYLAVLGALGAWAGGARMLRPVIRVTFWGAAAMVATAAVGKLFDTAVS